MGLPDKVHYVGLPDGRAAANLNEVIALIKAGLYHNPELPAEKARNDPEFQVNMILSFEQAELILMALTKLKGEG